MGKDISEMRIDVGEGERKRVYRESLDISVLRKDLTTIHNMLEEIEKHEKAIIALNKAIDTYKQKYGYGARNLLLGFLTNKSGIQLRGKIGIQVKDR